MSSISGGVIYFQVYDLEILFSNSANNRANMQDKMLHCWCKFFYIHILGYYATIVSSLFYRFLVFNIDANKKLTAAYITQSFLSIKQIPFNIVSKQETLSSNFK